MKKIIRITTDRGRIVNIQVPKGAEVRIHDERNNTKETIVVDVHTYAGADLVPMTAREFGMFKG